MKFLRYPGGKFKLLSFLVNYLPKQHQIKGSYIEPFVGGGAVFLYLQPNNAIIADLNQELIDLYRGIKNYPHKVWEIYSGFPEGKEAYYDVRNNHHKKLPLSYKAARTLYLNRTCFKGMWRHNSNGMFNVGYGGEERRWVISHSNIIALSKIFRRADIQKSDFSETLDKVKSGDFIFLDPPYMPGEKEMKDAHYINGRFTFEDQKRLADKLQSISRKKNICWMMTNSDHSDIRRLYKGFRRRKIPRGTSNRPGILTNQPGEILLSNY